MKRTTKKLINQTKSNDSEWGYKNGQQIPNKI